MVLVVAVLLIGACSSTTFVYNRLDFLIPWYINDYVDLDRRQSSDLDRLLQPFLAWHRTTELPRYRDWLDAAVASLDEPATMASVADFGARIQLAWSRLETEALEKMLVLGADLGDDQVEEFLTSLQKQQEKFEKKYLKRDEDEYLQELHDSLSDNAGDYLGRLDWGQRGLVDEAANAMWRSDQVWLRERAVWIERLRRILQREPGWQEALRESIALRDQLVSAEYTETIAHNTDIIQQLIVDLLNSRSPRQDRRLRKKLTDLRDDFQTLIDQPA
jgi:hypothetical protein